MIDRGDYHVKIAYMGADGRTPIPFRPWPVAHREDALRACWIGGMRKHRRASSEDPMTWQQAHAFRRTLDIPACGWIVAVHPEYSGPIMHAWSCDDR
jgi:hypothetical protein